MALEDEIVVRLSADGRGRLERLIRSGRGAACSPAHARILLKADAGEEGSWPGGRAPSDRASLAMGLFGRGFAGKGDIVVDFLHVIAIVEHT
jgi:hypothetical protein